MEQFKEWFSSAKRVLGGQFSLGRETDRNVLMGASLQAVLGKLEESKLGEKLAPHVLVDAVESLVSQERFAKSPFALNEFGSFLSRHGFHERALPLFATAATNYPTDTPEDLAAFKIVRGNLLNETLRVNKKALTLRRQRKWNEALRLFNLVVTTMEPYLNKLAADGEKDPEIQHEQGTAVQWIDVPPDGFRPRGRRRR